MRGVDDDAEATAMHTHWAARGARPPRPPSPTDPSAARAARREARAAEREAAASRLPWREEVEALLSRDFEGLPEQERIAEVFTSALTEGTAEAYSRHFTRFAEWCEAQEDRPCPLPATTDTVVRWLAGDVPLSPPPPPLSPFSSQRAPRARTHPTPTCLDHARILLDYCAQATSLTKLLEHADAGVRASALEGLGALPAYQRAKTGEHMVARLKDDDATVRRAALAALCAKRPGEGMGDAGAPA